MKSSIQNKIVFTCWLGIVAMGMTYFNSYSNAPGYAANPPKYWPVGSRIQRPDGSKATLLVFLHPRCPCSEATVESLSHVLRYARNKADIVAIVYRPHGSGSKWQEGRLMAKLRSLEPVKIMVDEGGVQARLFDVQTSGQTMLYDAQGYVVFSGGITPSRGHNGDSEGRDSIEGYLSSNTSKGKISKVFGCSLRHIQNIEVAGNQ
jgi:hypothetical protein